MSMSFAKDLSQLPLEEAMLPISRLRSRCCSRQFFKLATFGFVSHQGPQGQQGASCARSLNCAKRVRFSFLVAHSSHDFLPLTQSRLPALDVLGLASPLARSPPHPAVPPSLGRAAE